MSSGNKDGVNVESLFSVKDKVVLVTGGGRGIGEMIAEGFVANGAKVYICSRNHKACSDVAKELTARGPGRCYPIGQDGLDLSQVSHCEAVAQLLKEKEGKLDVLVNNSGCTWGEPMEQYQEKGWDKVMNLNVKGVFYLTRACLPLLLASATPENPARVINVGSIAGINPQVIPTYAYDSSKAAVHMLTRKLAKDLAARHITVNAIAPGFVPSKMSDQILTYMSEERIKDMIPLGRLGRPSDIAGACLYLASRAAAWTTAIILPVEGGAAVSPTPESAARLMQANL
ncbi:Rhamnolipids biosynthesis 3-oxoacyl-[acyl-carrier-protein] reductase [Balamuthia mandrillaris]